MSRLSINNLVLGQTVKAESFEEIVDITVSGINSDVSQLSGTQRKMGIIPRRTPMATVVEIHDDMKVFVDFSRDRSGKVIQRKAKDGSSYSFCQVTIVEPPKCKFTGGEQITVATDYRKFFNKKTGEWTMVEGAAMRLNYDPVEGKIVKNSSGTFARVMANGNIACNFRTDTITSERVFENYYRELVTKSFNTATYKLEEDAKIGKYVDRDAYNAYLDDIELRVLHRLQSSKVEDADILSKFIASGFGQCAEYHARRTARVLKIEGDFRVFRYNKEDARGNPVVQLTTNFPNKKVLACRNCDNQDILVYEDGGEKKHACRSCGVVSDGAPKERYVDVHRPNDRGFRSVYDIAKEMIPYIEAAYRKEMGIASKRCNGFCSDCSSCVTKVYGQNMDLPGVRCAKNMSPEMELDQHWEQDERDYTWMGSNAYLGHSVAEDDAVGLYPRLHLATHGKRNAKGRFNRKLDSYRPVKTLQRTEDGLKWRVAKDRWVTFPQFEGVSVESLRRTINKAWESGVYPHSTLIKAPRPVTLSEKQLAILYSNTHGRAAYELPSWLTFQKLGVMYVAFAKSLAYDLGLTEVVVDPENGDIFGDSLDMIRFERLVEHLVDILDPELEETVPDMDEIRQFLSVTHPLFQSIILEEGCDKSLRLEYPTVYRDMQEFILGESNPRMIKAGSSKDIMVDKFDSSGCIEHSYK